MARLPRWLLVTTLLASCQGESTPPDTGIVDAPAPLIDAAAKDGTPGDIVGVDASRVSVTELGTGASGPLHDVHGSGSGDIWVLSTRPHRFDGDRWVTHEPTVAPAGALWSNGPRDVWVSPSWHYDGARWQEHDLSGFEGLVRDIWSDGNEVWLVAGGIDGGLPFGEVGRYTEHGWSKPYAVSDQFLHAIWGVSSDEFWVGGGAVEGATRLSRYLAGAWSEVSALPVARSIVAAHGRAGDEIWAVGGRYVLGYDGYSWTQAYALASGELQDIFALGPGQAIAVGKQGAIWRLDQGHWSPIDAGIDADWHAVWALDRANVFVVGGSGGAPTAIRLDLEWKAGT